METLPKTEATKAFAKMYLNLEYYFYKIAPKKEVEETWENKVYIEFDEYGEISLPAPQPPVSLDEFQKAGEEFISELNENVLTFSDDMNRAILNVKFPKSNFPDMTPTREMLIKADLFYEALLLEKLLHYRGLINDLKCYDNGVLWPYNGMADYKEKLLRQQPAAKEEAQRVEPKRETMQPGQEHATPRIKVVPNRSADYGKENLQGENSTQTKGRGRPRKPFKDMMINDTDGKKLQRLHAIMKGKRGKGAALIILAAIKKGWLQMPTYPQVADEFGNIGAKQGFTHYLNENKFTKNEIEGAMKSLEQA